MANTSTVGDAGEYMAIFLLDRDTSKGSNFRAKLIGGKWPTVDLYIELEKHSGMYFFVQIKATTFRLKNAKRKLRCPVSKDKLNLLSEYHAPTYVIGVEVNKNDNRLTKGYLGAIKGKYTKGMGSISRTHLICPKLSIELVNEVLDFWKNSKTLKHKSVHKSKFSI